MSRIKERILSSKKYLKSLHIIAKKEWNEVYDLYKENKLVLEQKMALIHPINYKHKIDETAILMKRNFDQELVIQSIDCQSDLIWGYECEIQNDLSNNIQADHLFPYSLGGPTLPTNKVHLCKRHNHLKGSDIHLFPWEKGKPEWLDNLVSDINERLGR